MVVQIILQKDSVPPDVTEPELPKRQKMDKSQSPPQSQQTRRKNSKPMSRRRRAGAATIDVGGQEDLNQKEIRNLKQQPHKSLKQLAVKLQPERKNPKEDVDPEEEVPHKKKESYSSSPNKTSPQRSRNNNNNLK